MSADKKVKVKKCGEKKYEIKYSKNHPKNLSNYIRRSKFEYIYKIELQQNGKLHIHILLKDVKNKELFISNEDISKICKIGNQLHHIV